MRYSVPTSGWWEATWWEPSAPSAAPVTQTEWVDLEWDTEPAGHVGMSHPRDPVPPIAAWRQEEAWSR